MLLVLLNQDLYFGGSSLRLQRALLRALLLNPGGFCLLEGTGGPSGDISVFARGRRSVLGGQVTVLLRPRISRRLALDSQGQWGQRHRVQSVPHAPPAASASSLPASHSRLRARVLALMGKEAFQTPACRCGINPPCGPWLAAPAPAAPRFVAAWESCLRAFSFSAFA